MKIKKAVMENLSLNQEAHIKVSLIMAKVTASDFTRGLTVEPSMASIEMEKRMVLGYTLGQMVHNTLVRN